MYVFLNKKKRTIFKRCFIKKSVTHDILFIFVWTRVERMCKKMRKKKANYILTIEIVKYITKIKQIPFRWNNHFDNSILQNLFHVPSEITLCANRLCVTVKLIETESSQMNRRVIVCQPVIAKMRPNQHVRRQVITTTICKRGLDLSFAEVNYVVRGIVLFFFFIMMI